MNDIIPEANFCGVFPTGGFVSGLFVIQNNSIISVNYRCSKNTTFKIHTSPSQALTEKSLFFQKTIALNTTFHRRFACPNQFIQIEVVNDDGAVGNVILQTTATNATQFDCSTFLNSNIGIDATTNLVRVGNDYNTDMVREIHADFKKVNIQAFTQTQDAAEATIGNNGGNITGITVASYALYGNFAGTQDTAAGTGAKSITIDYIDANYDEQTATISSGAGGLVNLGITGRAVSRITVASVGTGKANSGSITITDSTNTHKFAYMPTGDNVSHTGVYLIPRNKQLIITDAQISCVGYNGLIRIYEWDYGGIETKGSIGDFKLTPNNLAQTFRLNGKITEKKAVVINVIPDAGTPTYATNICINVNAVLCPAINNF